MNTPELMNPADVAADLIGVPAAASISAPAAVPAAASIPAPAAAPAAAAPSAPPTPDGMIDKAGRVFDAARYKALPDGTPFRNRLGYFMPIGGRKAVSAPSVPAPVADAVPVPEPPAGPAWSAAETAAAASPAAGSEAASAPAGTAPANAVLVDHSDDAAEVVTRAVYFTIGVIFDASDEAEPSKQEHEQARKTFAAYIRATGWKGSALAGLVLWFCAYLLRFMQKPKAAAKVQQWKANLWKKSPPGSAPAAAAAASHAPAAPTASAGLSRVAPASTLDLAAFGERPAA